MKHSNLQLFEMFSVHCKQPKTTQLLVPHIILHTQTCRVQSAAFFVLTGFESFQIDRSVKTNSDLIVGMKRSLSYLVDTVVMGLKCNIVHTLTVVAHSN